MHTPLLLVMPDPANPGCMLSVLHSASARYPTTTVRKRGRVTTMTLARLIAGWNRGRALGRGEEALHSCHRSQCA